jgi:hypothetical protein
LILPHLQRHQRPEGCNLNPVTASQSSGTGTLMGRH